MSDPFTIQLSRGRAIALTACLIGAAMLLFIAGTATGLLVASQATDINAATPKRLQAETERLPAAPSVAPEQESKRDSSDEPSETTAAPATNESGTDTPDVKPTGAPTSESSETQPRSAPSSDAAPSGNAVPQAAFSKPAIIGSPHNQGASMSEVTEENGIPLAVKVCSFSSKASADKMVASLAERGYQASLTRSVGADGRTWYVVKLGPYSEWDTASTVAAKVAIVENVRPMVGPLR